MTIRKRSRRGHDGFTLVEALSAGMILALAAGVLATAVSSGLRSLELARDFQRAAELVDRTLTKIDLLGPDRLQLEGPREGRFPPPDERFSWDTTIQTRAEGHLYEVTVRISWPAVSGHRSVQAQTLLNDPPRSRDERLQWDDL